jgi:hypothetical protein
MYKKRKTGSNCFRGGGVSGENPHGVPTPSETIRVQDTPGSWGPILSSLPAWLLTPQIALGENCQATRGIKCQKTPLTKFCLAGPERQAIPQRGTTSHDKGLVDKSDDHPPNLPRLYLQGRPKALRDWRDEWGRSVHGDSTSGLVQIIEGGASTAAGRESSNCTARPESQRTAHSQVEETENGFVWSRALKRPESCRARWARR